MQITELPFSKITDFLFTNEVFPFANYQFELISQKNFFSICFVSQIRVISSRLTGLAFLLKRQKRLFQWLLRKLAFIGEISLTENSISWRSDFTITKSMFTGEAQWYNWPFVWVLTLRSMIIDHCSFHEDNSFCIYCLTKMSVPKVANRAHELRVLLSRGSIRGARPLFRFLSVFFLNERSVVRIISG